MIIRSFMFDFLRLSIHPARSSADGLDTNFDVLAMIKYFMMNGPYENSRVTASKARDNMHFVASLVWSAM